MECHEEDEEKSSATPRAVIQKAPRSKRPHNFSSTEGTFPKMPRSLKITIFVIPSYI